MCTCKVVIVDASVTQLCDCGALYRINPNDSVPRVNDFPNTFQTSIISKLKHTIHERKHYTFIYSTPPLFQQTVQKHSGGERTDANVNHSHSAFVSVVTVDSPPLSASHERKIIYDDRSSASLKATGQSAIRTVDDVPESTDSLKVADVSQCLRLLNMTRSS